MRRFQKGFTLVELAVTLIIIGVMVSIAVGAYRGVRSTTVHVQWQVLMSEAYTALVRFAADYGYLPPNQTEFDKIFSKRVDDFNYGGKIEYNVIDNDVSMTAFKEGGQICSLTNNDVSENPAGSGKRVVVTLSEEPLNRKGRLADKEIQLAELKSALKCSATGMPLSVVNQYLPVYKTDKSYSVNIKISGGILPEHGRYEFCVEIKPEDNQKLKCRHSASYIVKPDLFNNIFIDTPMEGVKISPNCTNDQNWSPNGDPKLVINKISIGSIEQLSPGTLPIKIFVRDSAGNEASKELVLPIESPPLTLTTDCGNL